uniref:Nucleoside diphosphate kinase n=1 Tax=Kalanchoe fedtschenkoi TaxID=63787 RepID=A0A7N0ZXB9_KALFE
MLTGCYWHGAASYGIGRQERTLVLIKPDGVKGNYTDRIKNTILESGFLILRERTQQLNDETAAKFYAEHSSKGFFSSLVKYMTSGPLIAMVLEKDDAVAAWRGLIGPTDAHVAKVTHPNSIRAMCGLNMEENCVHGSDSPQSAEREISFFFEDLSAGESLIRRDEL